MRNIIENNPGLADHYCKMAMKSDPNLPLKLCLNNSFLPSMRHAVLLAVAESRMNRFWTLEEKQISRNSWSALNKIASSNLSPEERLSQANTFNTLVFKRSNIIADNLIRKMRKEKAGKKRRIIIFSTGSHHAPDVIQRLKANGNLSIIGLLPPNFANELELVERPPQ